MLLGMGLLGMGVVSTQHIREEYYEDDDYEDEDDEEGAYQGIPIGMIGDIPPVVEGGGPSTGVVNTHGNGQYSGTQNTGSRQTMVGEQQHQMAVGEVVIGPGMNHRYHAPAANEVDDESNINSDEQDEYLEGSNQANFQYQQYMQTEKASSRHNQGHGLKQHSRPKHAQSGYAQMAMGPAYSRHEGPPQKKNNKMQQNS